MSGFRYSTPYQTALDTAGVTLPGALLYFYQSDTATPLATYSDAALSLPNTNPVIADAGGLFPNIFLQSGLDYKVILKDADGNQLWQADPVTGGGVTIAIETVTNIAALRALSANSLLLGSIIYVRGYYTDNDGGEGFFLCTDQNPGADNGGTIIWSSTTGFYYLRDTQSAPLSLKWFGAKGDGATDDSIAMQRWLDAIQSGFAGYIPAVSAYYKYATTLVKNGYVSIFGDGIGSRIHYAGAGEALQLGNVAGAGGPRFSNLMNFYLTGTSAAINGIHIREAQQGLSIQGVMVDGFSGSAPACALQVDASWDIQIRGGALKNSTRGLFLTDHTQSLGIDVCNNISVWGVDLTGNGTAVTIKNGAVFNFIGCDLSSTGVGFDIAPGTASPDRVQQLTIAGNYCESVTCIQIGNGAYGNGACVYVSIYSNYLNGSAAGIFIYNGDSINVGQNTVGVGASTVEAGVTGLLWGSENVLNDNTPNTGDVTYWRPNANVPNMLIKQIQVTDFMLLPRYTVNSLPAASTPGQTAYVIDANATTFASVVATGGSNFVPVYSDGTNWRIG